VTPVTTDALLAYVRRHWWFVLVQGLVVVVVVTMVLAARDDTSHERTVHFVLHPASESSVGDVTEGIDVSRQDGPLVQTILKVLGSSDLLERAAREVRAGDVAEYDVVATVAPGSNYFDVTVTGPADRTVDRLGDGMETVAPAYVESSYNGFQFDVLGRDDGSRSSFPPGADVLFLAFALGAIAAAAELAVLYVVRSIATEHRAGDPLGPRVAVGGGNGHGGSAAVTGVLAAASPSRATPPPPPPPAPAAETEARPAPTRPSSTPARRPGTTARTTARSPARDDEVVTEAKRRATKAERAAENTTTGRRPSAG
jgi:hypothetical protein